MALPQKKKEKGLVPARRIIYNFALLETRELVENANLHKMEDMISESSRNMCSVISFSIHSTNKASNDQQSIKRYTGTHLKKKNIPVPSERQRRD